MSDSFVGFTISDLIVRVLVAPFTALAAAVLFFELKALRGEPVLGTGGGGRLAPTGADRRHRAPSRGTAPATPPTTGPEGTGSGPPG